MLFNALVPAIYQTYSGIQIVYLKPQIQLLNKSILMNKSQQKNTVTMLKSLVSNRIIYN